MISHDCTRQFEVVSFIECQAATTKSGWFLDYFFRDRRTRAEKLEVRKYAVSAALPLFYTGACQPPNLISKQAESLTLQELTFPTIKAETAITGCDVDERRITPQGDTIPVGIERFNEALNWGMKSLFDGLRMTHIGEAVSVLKTGGYVIRSSDGPVGTVDFGRRAALQNINLVATGDDWTNPCSKPFKVIDAVANEMAACGGIAGAIDVIYGLKAWEALEAHQERDRVIDGGIRATVLDVSRSIFSAGQSLFGFGGYNDVYFRGTTNGGTVNHWVSMAKYLDFAGVETDVVAPGEILIVSRDAFDGQRIYRTVTSDNREELPDGSLPLFMYDDLDEEYNRKCRTYNPWMEEYHLMVPSNVNGAAVVRVVADDAVICVPCEQCPPVVPVVPV